MYNGQVGRLLPGLYSWHSCLTATVDIEILKCIRYVIYFHLQRGIPNTETHGYHLGDLHQCEGIWESPKSPGEEAVSRHMQAEYEWKSGHTMTVTETDEH